MKSTEVDYIMAKLKAAAVAVVEYSPLNEDPDSRAKHENALTLILNDAAFRYVVENTCDDDDSAVEVIQ